MPAAKKHSSTRSRSHRASTAATLTAAGAVPKSQRPRLPRERVWHRLTRQWWDDVWAAPMSGEYHESDRHGLFVLACLVDDFWSASSASARREAAAEIRLQRQSFGLTPYDRRRLEWSIESVSQAKDRGEERRAAKRPAADKGDPQPADPRETFRVVS
ncbi:MAG: hypothetical protein ACRDOJ_11945 [Nocardioidaceae bacterium]